ncbi:hypothetical protein CLV58_12582 [Spirosoma oryzae]|uniref:Uncharacterized protein n=1 Tax=Spirosoma oryzae TaxID=1469603 RepID=A0A2T0S8R8_9BACT|nr:hypothetical protein [Spirosoma oryzae]PRY29820.1 hypothetical protein CLV58_12582 [Spirosoma oryzae]
MNDDLQPLIPQTSFETTDPVVAAPASAPVAAPVTTAPAAPIAATPAAEPAAPANDAAPLITSAPAEEPSAGAIIATTAEPTADAAPAATEATPDPVTIATGENPFDSIDFDEMETVAPAATPAATAEQTQYDLIAQTLGLEKAPTSADEARAALDAEVNRRMAVAGSDPIRQIDAMLALDNESLVRGAMLQTKSPYQTDEMVNALVDDMITSGQIETMAAQIRQQLTTNRGVKEVEISGQVAQQQQQQQEAQRQYEASRREGQQKVTEAIVGLKDPMGRAYPERIQNAITNYILQPGEDGISGYMAAFMAMPPEWHAQMAAQLHPKIGPVLTQQMAQRQQMAGQSNLLKELEHSTPDNGAGGAASTGPKVVGSDAFTF